MTDDVETTKSPISTEVAAAPTKSGALAAKKLKTMGHLTLTVAPRLLRVFQAVGVGGVLKHALRGKIPVIGAAVSAGFVAWEVGESLLKGNLTRSFNAAVAGTAEVAAATFGFGAGDVAREIVRGGLIKLNGEQNACDKSALRSLAEIWMDKGDERKEDIRKLGSVLAQAHKERNSSAPQAALA